MRVWFYVGRDFPLAIGLHSTFVVCFIHNQVKVLFKLKGRVKNCIRQNRQISARKCVKNSEVEHHVQSQVPSVPTQPFQLRVLAAPAPVPCQTPLMHKNRSSTFNSVQPKPYRYTTLNSLPNSRPLSPYIYRKVISSKFYLFRFIDAVVSLNLLWIKCNPHIFCLLIRTE